MKQLTDKERNKIVASASQVFCDGDCANAFIDVCNKAFSIYDDKKGGDLYDIAEKAIEEGLTSDDYKWAVLRHYSDEIAETANWKEAHLELQCDIVDVLEAYEEAMETKEAKK